MIFCNNTVYAKVWKITPAEKYLDLQISTSEKAQDGSYINSSWFARCIGHAFNSLKDKLKEGDRIVINKCKFTNEKYTAKDGTTKSAFRFVILEASIEPQNPTNRPTAQPEPAATEAAQPAQAPTEEECPW